MDRQPLLTVNRNPYATATGHTHTGFTPKSERNGVADSVGRAPRALGLRAAGFAKYKTVRRTNTITITITLATNRGDQAASILRSTVMFRRIDAIEATPRDYARI